MHYILWLMLITIVFHITSAEKTTLIINEDFFRDIVGVDEKTFRDTHKWKLGQPVVIPQQDEWVKDYLRRAAIFYQIPFTKTASITSPALGEINIHAGVSVSEWEAYMKRDSKPLANEPIFSIQFFDPSKKIESDIRWLQANPQLKNVVFQIASNFNTLEGGMGGQDGYLTNMLQAPVQGELASISAASGTIRRKYFFGPFNLLYRLEKDGIKMNESDGFASLTDETLQKIADGSIKISDINYKDIAVCLHEVVVTSGSGGIGKNQEVLRLPVTVENGKIDKTKTQIVNQVFTAALDTYTLRSGIGRDGKNVPILWNKNLENFAKLILKASYEGTLKAAFYAEQPRVILTLIGGGSFRNDIAWIAEVLEGLEQFIKEKGMQVVLMYRPDKIRDIPVRTVDGDIEFLKRMVTLANKVNGTNYNLDLAIEGYVAKMYGKKPYSSEVAELQSKFPLELFYTPIAPKIPSTPPSRDTPPPLIDTTNIIALLNKFTQALNNVRNKLGSKSYSPTGALVKILPNDTYQVGSKTIKLIKGDITAQKNIDVLVNAANDNVTTIGSGGIAGAIGSKMLDSERKVFAREIESRYSLPANKQGKVGGAYLGKLQDGSFLNKLGYKYLINAVGPICPSQDVNLVANAYRNSLEEAAKVGATSIVIPRISAIIFNCDPDIIDPLAVKTVVNYLAENPGSSLQTIYLIFYDGQPLDMIALEKYRVSFSKLFAEMMKV